MRALVVVPHHRRREETFAPGSSSRPSSLLAPDPLAVGMEPVATPANSSTLRIDGLDRRVAPGATCPSPLPDFARSGTTVGRAFVLIFSLMTRSRSPRRRRFPRSRSFAAPAACPNRPSPRCAPSRRRPQPGSPGPACGRRPFGAGRRDRRNRRRGGGSRRVQTNEEGVSSPEVCHRGHAHGCRRCGHV
jgi:hypothetical protein